MGEELITAGADSQYLALRMDQKDLVEMIRETVGADGLSPQDLDRVKVPSGGGQAWEVPTIDGDSDATKYINGVVLEVATRRAYWPEKYSGANDPPECFSNDGFIGVGEPGGTCAECPLNEFHTADDGDGPGKACKETRQLFVLTEDSIIPMLVTVPPASIQSVKQYRIRLLRGQQRITDVVTSIGLKKANSKSGIEYSQVTLARAQTLDPDAASRMRAYAASIQPAVAAAGLEREEVEG